LGGVDLPSGGVHDDAESLSLAVVQLEILDRFRTRRHHKEVTGRRPQRLRNLAAGCHRGTCVCIDWQGFADYAKRR
jgi:hypothetical protein